MKEIIDTVKMKPATTAGILVGVTLMVEGFDVHVPKGYIYFAMAFSVGVEMLKLRMRKRLPEPVTHAGRTLCEDCCMDVMAAPKACDPWAVYSATRTASQDKALTSVQNRILDVVKTRGPLSQERICGDLGISEAEFRSNFATLRHMELARACKVNGGICYARFDLTL